MPTKVIQGLNKDKGKVEAIKVVEIGMRNIKWSHYKMRARYHNTVLFLSIPQAMSSIMMLEYRQ